MHDPKLSKNLVETAKRLITEATGYDASQIRGIHEATRAIVKKLQEDGHLPVIFDVERMKRKSNSSKAMVEYSHGSGSRGVTFVWEESNPIELHVFVGTSKNRSWQKFTGSTPEEALKNFLAKYPYGE